MPQRLKYRPAHDLPLFAKQYNTISPLELSKLVLANRNKETTPESITMYFKRNPTVYDELKNSIVEAQILNKEVDPTIFLNGTFEELKSVKNWITELNDRQVVNYKAMVGAIKRLCQGKFKDLDLVASGELALKHPDLLSLEDVQTFERLVRTKGIKDTHTLRLPARSFLESKQIVVGKKISGSKSLGSGALADLYVNLETLNKMFDYVKGQDFEAYATDFFMFKTATRINSSLNALIENMKTEEMQHKINLKGFIVLEEGLLRQIKVFDKGRRSKHPQGHIWNKVLSDDLFKVLEEVRHARTSGKLFENLNDRYMSKLNKQALQEFTPETLIKHPDVMPNHFFRHMFAQHCLRASGWNYGLTGALGGWDVKSLEESYGKMDALLLFRTGEINSIAGLVQ